MGWGSGLRSAWPPFLWTQVTCCFTVKGLTTWLSKDTVNTFHVVSDHWAEASPGIPRQSQLAQYVGFIREKRKKKTKLKMYPRKMESKAISMKEDQRQIFPLQENLIRNIFNSWSLKCYLLNGPPQWTFNSTRMGTLAVSFSLDLPDLRGAMSTKLGYFWLWYFRSFYSFFFFSAMKLKLFHSPVKMALCTSSWHPPKQKAFCEHVAFRMKASDL